MNLKWVICPNWKSKEKNLSHFGGTVYTPLTATLGAIIIGIGSGRRVLNIERFYREKSRLDDSLEALKAVYENIGVALAASGITTIFGFYSSVSSQSNIVRNFFMMMFLAVSLALLVVFKAIPVHFMRQLIRLEKPSIWMDAKLTAPKIALFWL